MSFNLTSAASFGVSTADPHGTLQLPDGRRVVDVDGGELYREFDRLKVAGFNHTLGRQTAIEKYAAHLGAVAKAGADAAIADYLQKNRG